MSKKLGARKSMILVDILSIIGMISMAAGIEEI